MIKNGSFVKITNLEKTYKFVDAKGRTMLPSSYKSITKHFDNLQVVCHDNDNYTVNVMANKLYFVTGISEADIEPIETFWTIDLNTGKVIQIETPTKAMYILGLVFKTEEAAINFYTAKKEKFENKD